MKHKTCELIETKTVGDMGEFVALASVFGNVDLVGDRMMPGAFTKTLERWRASGDPLPIILSHSWDDPMAHIGKADPNDVEQTDVGLVVKGKLDITDNAVAKQVYRLMKERRLTGWSFGYTVPSGGQKVADDGANEVSEVDLVEAGPTLKGANSEATLQAVKSALSETPLSIKDALSRTDLSQEVQDELAAKAAELEATEIEDEPGKEPKRATPASQDPLKDENDLLRLGFATDKPL